MSPSGSRSNPSPRSPLLAGVLSLILPGLGQVYARQTYRGLAVFLSVVVAALTSVWYGVAGYYLAPAVIWLWGIWDATGCARGRPRSALLPLAAILVMGYGIGWQVTSIDLSSLTKNLGRASSIVQPMFHPDFISQRSITNVGWGPIEVPCGPNPPAATNSVDNITVRLSPD